jgi:predicted transcriptional regulator
MGYKTENKTLTVYLPLEIADKVEKIASDADRSVNYILREIITKEVKKRKI